MIETAARSAQFLLAIGIAYLIALWFALVAWTFRDIESRSRSVFTQVFSTLLVVLFFVPGLLLYLILRPKETLDQAFQRALEEEYLLQDLDDLPLCPGCQRSVDAEFVLCPHCQTHLRGQCPSCSRLVDLRWSVCPYCTATIDPAALALPESGPGTTPALEDARAGRRRRAIAAAAERVGIPPDDLDAFTDALTASGSPAAVGAGTEGMKGSAESAATTGPFAGMRARFGAITTNPFERYQADENGHATPERTSQASAPGSGFWADPLPGTERRGDHSPSDQSGRN